MYWATAFFIGTSVAYLVFAYVLPVIINAYKILVHHLNKSSCPFRSLPDGVYFKFGHNMTEISPKRTPSRAGRRFSKIVVPPAPTEPLPKVPVPAPTMIISQPIPTPTECPPQSPPPPPPPSPASPLVVPAPPPPPPCPAQESHQQAANDIPPEAEDTVEFVVVDESDHEEEHEPHDHSFLSKTTIVV